MLSFRRRLSTILAHLGEEGIAARWIVLNATLAIVGVVGIYVSISPTVNIALAGLSAVMLLSDVLRYRREQGRTTFVRRQIDDFVDVKRSLAADGRSRIIAIHGQTFVLDQEVSRLIGENTLSAFVRPNRYVLRAELKKFGGRYRRERLAKTSEIFDGPVLGWGSSVSDASLLGPTVELVSGTFFDRLATDYFAAVDTRWDGIQTLIDGRRLYIDRNGSLRDFGESWLFNGIGVSTIAITSDGMLVLTEQSVRNVGEPGLLAPSGSGSLEPRDFAHSERRTVAELAIAGANRELQEEASVDPLDIEESLFLGFGRWLNKAACPEMFSVTFLNIDSHELRRRKRRQEERIYVDGVSTIRPVLDIAEWNDCDPLEIVPESERARVSLPLGVNLTLLVHSVIDNQKPLLVSKLGRLLQHD